MTPNLPRHESLSTKAPQTDIESSSQVRDELRSIIEQVTEADDYVYGAIDSAKQTMDTAKIIEDPNGGYLAIYHSQTITGDFSVSVATSANLIDWTFRTGLGENASQPYIYALADGGFVVAWEQEPCNHLAFRYYEDRDALFNAVPSREFDAPQTLSSFAEGTPSIYNVELSPDIDQSTIDVGAHYYFEGQRDLQQRGTLVDFSQWTTEPQPDLDAALMQHGIQGNIGDRDTIRFRGHLFSLIEGQREQGEWATWQVFLYDHSTGEAEPLDIKTFGGSTAFANPTVTNLRTPTGENAVVVTLFIPSESLPENEHGQLIYYRTYESDETSDD